jgi:hypothetical protein
MLKVSNSLYLLQIDFLKDVIDQSTPGIFGSSNPWVLDRARGTRCCVLDLDHGDIHLNNFDGNMKAWDGSITSFERAWVAKLVSVVRHHECDENRNRDFVGGDAWVIGATALYLIELLSTASRVAYGQNESWVSEQSRRYGSGWIQEWSASDVYVSFASRIIQSIIDFADLLVGLPNTIGISCYSQRVTLPRHRPGCKAAFMTHLEPHQLRSEFFFYSQKFGLLISFCFTRRWNLDFLN